MAATPLTGEPLATNAMAGPEPSRTSMESPAAACCMRASPANAVSSTSTLFFWKIPSLMPTSGGTKEKASATALPTRILSAAKVGEVASSAMPQAISATKRLLARPNIEASSQGSVVAAFNQPLSA